MKNWKELVGRIEGGLIHLREGKNGELKALRKEIKEKCPGLPVYQGLSEKVEKVWGRVEEIQRYIREFKQKT